jgi:hypothetical protein
MRGRVAGSQPMSTAVHMEPRSNSIFNLLKEYLITLGVSVGIVFRSSGTLWLMLAASKKRY